MANYGKIIIIADSIAEAEKELATIKALANAGAVYGKGSTDEGIEIKMGNVSSSDYRYTDCSICSNCCQEEPYPYDDTDEYEEDDFNGTDDYEEDDYNENDDLNLIIGEVVKKLLDIL